MAPSLKEGDYVTQKGTNNPTGVIERIYLGLQTDIADVRWGTADGQTFKDAFRLDELQKVEERIYSPDEVVERQVKEAGGKKLQEEE